MIIEGSHKETETGIFVSEIQERSAALHVRLSLYISRCASISRLYHCQWVGGSVVVSKLGAFKPVYIRQKACDHDQGSRTMSSRHHVIMLSSPSITTFWELVATFVILLHLLATFAIFWQLWQLLRAFHNFCSLLATFAIFWQLFGIFYNFWYLKQILPTIGIS